MNAKWSGGTISRSRELKTPVPGQDIIAVKVRGVEAFNRVNNVLDSRHETFGTFAVNGRAAGRPVQRFLTPAPPITALIGLQYAF